MPDNPLQRHVLYCMPADPEIQRTGDPAENDAVTFLAHNLKLTTEGDFRIIKNYHIRLTEPGVIGSLEVDIIVICKQGVYVIEVKGWRGTVNGSDNRAWEVVGSPPRKNALLSVQKRAEILQERLTRRHGVTLPFLNDVGFAHLVVFTDPNVTYLHNPPVSSDLLPVMKMRDQAFRNAFRDKRWLPSAKITLSDPQIVQIADVLFKEHQPKTAKENFLDRYILVEKLLPGELYAESFQAEHIWTGVERRIKRYQLTHLSERREENLKHFMRSTKAVTALGNHPNIVQTVDFFQDPDRDDTFFEVSEAVHGKRLDEIMAACTEPMPLAQQLDYLIQICRGVQHTHEHNIFHRNLSPVTIFVTTDGTVKIADFDYAKIIGPTVDTIIYSSLERLGAPLPSGFCTAPELAVIASAASPQSDIYSVGALWYLLAGLPIKTQEKEDAPKAAAKATPPPAAPTSPNIEQIDQFQLPPEARNLMKKMLNTIIKERPGEISQVLKQLEGIQKQK